jgi:DNA-binding NtrC family response regulator
LSTALGFAQQSGGDLSISSAPGEGTTVSLFLPEAAPAAAQAPRGHGLRPVPKDSVTVLVVDDERRMRRLARRTLSELGYRVIEAENAVDAARLLEKDDSVDLLFTDVVMPGEIDGRTLVQWACLEHPGLKVLLTSGFAQQSGGDLSIRSAPGEGTTVSLYLPEAAPAAAQAPRGHGLHPVPKDSVTVLVVDEELRMRRLARRTLSELGYRVIEAENAAAAARLLEKDASVDLLFTDVAMPGEIDGRTLGQWARLERPGLKVLLTSGFPQQPADEEAPEGEALPFLKKPYSKELLQEAVQTLLDAQAS